MCGRNERRIESCVCSNYARRQKSTAKTDARGALGWCTMYGATFQVVVRVFQSCFSTVDTSWYSSLIWCVQEISIAREGRRRRKIDIDIIVIELQCVSSCATSSAIANGSFLVGRCLYRKNYPMFDSLHLSYPA